MRLQAPAREAAMSRAQTGGNRGQARWNGPIGASAGTWLALPAAGDHSGRNSLGGVNVRISRSSRPTEMF